MPKNRLSDTQRGYWAAEFAIAEEFDRLWMRPTRIFAEAAKKNAVHWQELRRIVPNVPEGFIEGWKYPMVTANYLYANQQAVMPRVLMREPKVTVRPAQRMTRAYARSGQNPDPVDRWIAAMVCQQIANWRLREFDFTKQVRRCVKDDHSRGMAFIRHGYIAEGDKTLTRNGKSVEFENHKQLREGWPYAVHQPLDYTRWDQKAREIDDRQWVAFGKLWRPEDLKQWLGLRRDLPITTYIGKDLNASPEWQELLLEDYGMALGFTLCYEIWDRRDGKVIFWLPESHEDLKVVDWPLQFTGLPDSFLCSNESNERIEPVPESAIIWELQQELNKLISLVIVYAKRGVPIVGANKGVMDEDDADRISEAEIYETILFKDDPNKALAVLNINTVPQTLLMAIQEIKNALREVGSVSNFERGTRENVTSATEAAAISQGGDLRQAMRAEAVRSFFGEVIRKDWQTLQQVTTDDQIVDVAVEGAGLFQVRATRDQIQMEYDFTVNVGSTEPPNEQRDQVNALAFINALRTEPQLMANVSPRFLVSMVCRAFGYDENEVLVTLDTANQQVMANKLQDMFGPGSQAAVGKMMGAGMSGALQQLNPVPDNNANVGPVQ